MTQPAQSPGDWPGVLDEIRQAIEAALAESLARDSPQPDENLPAPAWPALADASERIGRLNGLCEQARDRQEGPARELAEGEERLRRWLAEAEAARRRLAEWASRSVG